MKDKRERKKCNVIRLVDHRRPGRGDVERLERVLGEIMAFAESAEEIASELEERMDSTARDGKTVTAIRGLSTLTYRLAKDALKGEA